MIKFVVKYLGEYRFEFLLIIFCAAMTSAADLAMPYLSAKFIDEVLVTRNFEGLYFFVAVLFGMSLDEFSCCAVELVFCNSLDNYSRQTYKRRNGKFDEPDSKI